MIERVFEGRTLNDMFQQTASEGGDRVALVGADGTTVTWRQYAQRVEALALRWSLLGVRPHSAVALLLPNCPDFDVLDTSLMHAGAVPVSLPEADPVELLVRAVDTAHAVVLVTRKAAADHVLEVARASATGPTVVVTDGDVDGAISLAEFESRQPAAESDFEALWRSVDPSDDATILFSSGTTGAPKAIRLPHRAIVLSERNQNDIAPIGDGGHVLSYLPLTHIAERFMAHYLSICFGVTIHHVPDPDVLYDEIARIHPTRFTGLPRVWEKIEDRVQRALAGNQDWRAAEQVGLACVRAEQSGRELTQDERDSWNRALDTLAPLRAQLGFDRAENLAVCAGITSPALLEQLAAVGLPVCNIWGMSEAINLVMNPPERLKFTAVGKFLRGIEGRIADDGEILARGDSVFNGYLNDPVRTAELFDENGWVHTGDLGAIDDEGYLSIIGRKKDILVTATGLNVAPGLIEAALRDSTPLIDQAMAVADGRRFVTAVIALDAEALRDFAAANGLAGDFAQLITEPAVRAEVARAVERANATLDQTMTVRGWVLSDAPWEPGGDELTSTSKLRRDNIAARWAADIDRLYAR